MARKSCFCVQLYLPPGFHTTAREPKRAHFRAPALQKPTKIPRKDPQEREERMKIVAGREKKARNCWAPHPSGAPPLGAPPLGAPPLGAPPFGAPPFGGPTFPGPPRSRPTPFAHHSRFGLMFFVPFANFYFVPYVFFVPFVIFYLSPNVVFFVPFVFFLSRMQFLFCPDNRLLILSRFRFFCPVMRFFCPGAPVRRPSHGKQKNWR